jgi:hypothetical protein
VIFFHFISDVKIYIAGAQDSLTQRWCSRLMYEWNLHDVLDHAANGNRVSDSFLLFLFFKCF